MRFILRVEALVAAALIVTGLAAYFRQELTRDTIHLSRLDQGAKLQSYAYSGVGATSGTNATLISPFSWECVLSASRNPVPHCGLGLDLDPARLGSGLDLSKLDTIELDFDYQGSDEIVHLALANTVEARAGATEGPAVKVNQATLRIGSGSQRRSVRKADFLVPQWWLDEHKLANSNATPSFDNVTSIELIISGSPGRHRLTLNSVSIHATRVSIEAWYGGIAVCWMLLAATILMRRRKHVERWSRELADRTLNSIPEVIWSVGPDGWPDFVSQQWREHYGGDPSALLGRGWLKIIHPEDRDMAVAKWKQALQARAPYEAEYRILLADGSYRWAVARARPEFGADGAITRWYGTCTDAHDRVLAVEALKSSERLYRGILEASIDCVAVLSADGLVELVNGPGVEATELGSADLIQGRPFTALWQRKSEEIVAGAVGRARAGEVVRFQSFCPTANGTPKWWDVVLTPMPDESGQVTGILAIARDITADREKSEQLRWASEHDALTSLPNRRAFQARLQSATLRAMKSNEQIGLLIVDLDHFKHVNDSLGHIAGDIVLQAVAERLRGALRKSDFVARIGGDEFAIILEGLHEKDEVMALGQKMFADLQTPFRLRGRAFSAGASIGGALFPKDAQSANDLFTMADTALYALKGSGRGGTMLFHPYMLEEVEKAAEQLGVARHAVSEKTVVPVYQPKVEIQSGAIVGFEALLRWKHPRNGLQLPATVEEAFKDYELAAKIGELMQHGVAAHLRSWIAAGLQFGRVSINASPAEFLRDDYAERLLAVLREHHVPASAIEVEVTEHALLDQGPEYVARALASLKAAGVRVSLDDFGTGYSSLSHLRDFPVDLVKIDKSFVQQMGEDPEIASIVGAVINLARSIDIDVVAEGVETPAQLDLLRSMGCRLAQGHLFGKPIEEAEVLQLLDKSRAAA